MFCAPFTKNNYIYKKIIKKVMKKILLSLSILFLFSCQKKTEEAIPEVKMTSYEKQFIGKWIFYKSEINSTLNCDSTTATGMYKDSFIELTSINVPNKPHHFREYYGNLPETGYITEWWIENNNLICGGYPYYGNPIPTLISISSNNLILQCQNFTVYYYKK